jgi:hypothetical protein
MRIKFDHDKLCDDGSSTTLTEDYLFPRKNPGIWKDLAGERTRWCFQAIVEQLGDLEPDDENKALSDLELPIGPLEDDELRELVAHCTRLRTVFEVMSYANTVEFFDAISSAISQELKHRDEGRAWARKWEPGARRR